MSILGDDCVNWALVSEDARREFQKMHKSASLSTHIGGRAHGGRAVELCCCVKEDAAVAKPCTRIAKTTIKKRRTKKCARASENVDSGHGSTHGRIQPMVARLGSSFSRACRSEFDEIRLFFLHFSIN
jgi:hypothetical protein